MNTTTLFRLFLALWLSCGSVQMVLAQRAGFDDRQEVEVSADRLEYDADRKLLIGSGNVIVEQGANRLDADFVTVHTETEDVYAVGNVRFRGPDRTWQGEELHYNFNDETGDFGQFSAYIAPLHIRAGDSRRENPEFYVMHDVFISSCEGEYPEFYITASEASIENERYIRARNAVFRIGGVPVFYWPYYKYDMQRAGKWDFVPGYRSRWGAFLLTSYNYRLSDMMRAATHFDVRSGRGLALGQDFRWQNHEMDGAFKAYYARDTDRYKKKDDLTQEQKDLIKENRYRLHARHAQNLTDRDYVMANIDYLSDPDMMEDFFTQDYKKHVQPENYIAWNHVEDNFTYGLLLNKRLNDFYENVNRLPEATLDFRRQEIQDSGFYYEGNNAAAFLEREFPELTDADKLSTFRLNTRHMFYYPTKLAGFLNLTPRAGYQGTYYSTTRTTETSTNLIALISTNEVGETTTTFTNEIRTLVKDGSAKWRNLPELGFEASYQAFKVLDQAGAREGGLRHVAEPYTRYTFSPKPNVLPEDLHQFDYLDQLDKQNVIRLGIRNKLQTKRHGGVRNLLDVNVFADYRFDPREERGENKLGSLVFDGEARPLDELYLRFDGTYGTHGESFTHFNMRADYVEREQGRFGVEYRYRQDLNDQVTLHADLFPEERWNGGAYWRYQFIGAEMEEHSYYVGRRNECLSYKMGYTGRGDGDWDIWFQIWLTAFPQSQLRSAFGL